MPSLASRLVNAYKMKDDVLTIHLVGGARGARVVREGACALVQHAVAASFVMLPTQRNLALATAPLQGGMGCAAGVVAINIIRDLLKARPDTNVLFVCGENCTAGSYRGEDPM